MAHSKQTVIIYLSRNYPKNREMIWKYQSLGFSVIAMSNVIHPELELADENLVIPDHNIETILSFVKNKNIVTAVTSTDHFAGKVGEINDRMDLPGLRKEPANELNDKRLFDEFLVRNNLPRLDTIFPTTMDDIKNLKHESVIIKPTRSSGAWKSLEIEYEHWNKDELLRSNNISHQIMEINSHDPRRYSQHKKYGQIILQESLVQDYRWIVHSGIVNDKTFTDCKLGECHKYPFPHNIGLKWFDAMTFEKYLFLMPEEKKKISELTRKIVELTGLDNVYIQIEYVARDGQFYPVDVALRPGTNESYFPKLFQRMYEQTLPLEETVSYEESQDDDAMILKSYLFSLRRGKIKSVSYVNIEDVELNYSEIFKPGLVVPKFPRSGNFEPFLYIYGTSHINLFEKYHRWMENCNVEYF